MATHRPEDEAAIVALANKYTDAVNNRDWDRYRSCWTEDAVWDLGAPVNQKKEGLPAIMEEVQRAVGAMDLFIQMNHAVTVLSVDGDTARARATLNEIGRVMPAQRDLLNGAAGMFILAIYTDELRRTPDGWRYASRTYAVPYFDPAEPTGQVFPSSDKDGHVMATLNGKVAIVTGASSGIGRGIAERLGREGASVVVNYHSDEAGGRETANAVAASGARAEVVQGDLRVATDVERMFKVCLDAFGRPDILVNNAGVGVLQPLAETDEEAFERVYGLNCRGTLFCLKQASLHLNDEGRIVNIGSSSATYPWPNAAMYASSKAAVLKMTEIAAVELGPRRINVNSVIPGITATPMSESLPREATQPVVDASPWKRLGTPDDIAAVVAFLVGPDALWVTGQHILANGGSGH